MKILQFWRRGPSLPTAIALLALAVATTGTAVAATGQVVNITDPLNSANTARVTLGRLYVDDTPTKPVNGQVYTDGRGGGSVVIAANSATIQLTTVDFAPYFQDTAAWDVYLYQFAVSNAADCLAYSSLRRIGEYTAAPRETLHLGFDSPITLKPMGGSPLWCLIAYTVPTSSSNSVSLNWAGYVTSGSFSPSLAATNAGDTPLGTRP
jgi:hypothetical protein